MSEHIYQVQGLTAHKLHHVHEVAEIIHRVNVVNDSDPRMLMSPQMSMIPQMSMSPRMSHFHFFFEVVDNSGRVHVSKPPLISLKYLTIVSFLN